MEGAPAPRVVAVIPVGALERAKSRLGANLDAEERRDLVIDLLERTVAAALNSPAISGTIVVSPDDEVLAIASAAGAATIRQVSRGLNQGLDEARAAVMEDGADALLVLAGDLPDVSPNAVAEVVAVLDTSRPPLDTPRSPIVAIVPDRHGRGTNALLLAPPDVIDFAFGGDSRAAHRHAADSVCTRVVELGGPLTLDLDTPEDLLLVQAGARGGARGR